MEKEIKVKIHRLPPYLKKIMSKIHNIIGEERFILYGSTPIDLLLNKRFKIDDLDIAIEGINKNRIRKCREKMKKQGFEIVEPFRKYYIHKNKEVVLVYAKNDRWFLDIAFLDNPTLIGHFNIETLFFRYPQMDYLDKFGAIKSIKEKKIRLIRDSEKENPHLLLGRFLRLCSKYEIPLKENKHRKILLDLQAKIELWKIVSNFEKNAYTSCISSLLKSIVQSNDKRLFMRNLIDAAVLITIFPELENAVSVHRNEFVKEIPNVRKKLDVVVLFDKYLKTPERKLFERKIKALKVRHWNKQDIDCSNYFV